MCMEKLNIMYLKKFKRVLKNSVHMKNIRCVGENIYCH